MDNILTLKSTNNPCTGCGACSVICPSKCIDLKLDSESFFMPVVNEQNCTQCGLCVKVCYQRLDINNNKDGKELENCTVFAAINSDSKELKSVTSGGVASELSKFCLSNGFDVIGAVLNLNKNYAEHIIASCESDLERMKGSKYLQSYTINAFENIKPKNKTLIIGLPCQIYGMRKYIQQLDVEDNFILVDLFCRGVTPANLFKKYKEYLSANFRLSNLVDFNFRSKINGWHRFSLVAYDEAGKEYSETVYNDIYYSFYLKNMCMRESCYSCEFRHNRVFSDIRLGDFWGSKYYNNDEGVSIVSIYSERGEEIWEKISSKFIVEENEVSQLKKSQRFSKFPIPIYRSDVIKSLASQESLESIHSRLEIDKLGFYREEKKSDEK